MRAAVLREINKPLQILDRIRTDNWNPDAHPPVIGRMGQTLPYEFGNVQYAV